MRVIVTRPLAQAADWVRGLSEHGVDTAVLPLIAIEPAPDPAAVHEAWASLAERRLVVFVSPNAAAAFFEHAPAGSAWPAHVHAASPGPGTTAMLLDRGVPAAQVIEPDAGAARFDSESLWPRLQAHDWRGASVLLVRSTSGREWLSGKLRDAGARIDAVAAYARALPRLGGAERDLLAAAMAAPRAHVWLFSSAEAIDNLEALLDASSPAGAAPSVPLQPGTGPQGSVRGAGAHAAPGESAPSAGLGATQAAAPGDRWAAARAVATHPRIGARAQQLGFGAVHASRPTLAAVVACIQSLRP